MTHRFKKLLITVAALSALALGGSALAGAAGGSEQGENEGKAVPAAAADRAEKAALAETGGGKVNALEYDNENGATYEVEVAKPDGSTVDVRLDDRFAVVVVEGDSEAADEDADEPGHQD
jgi:uncharacterized membrane protein YkoI